METLALDQAGCKQAHFIPGYMPALLLTVPKVKDPSRDSVHFFPGF